MAREIQHICMADDDPDDHYLFEIALQEVTVSVKLTYFRTCNGLLDFLKAGDNLPDLIVLDMNMPGNDGCACLITIKKQAHLLHIPVIIYSTSSTPEIVKKAHEFGAFKYALKPPSITEMKELIKEMLTTLVRTG